MPRLNPGVTENKKKRAVDRNQRMTCQTLVSPKKQTKKRNRAEDTAVDTAIID
jgi:hypothetical protein